jgi:hypothetical protein
MKSTNQVENVTKASTWALTADELYEVETIMGNLRPEWIKDQIPKETCYRFGTD